ncbi:MAG: hemin ABC transporter substrate-binding protein [Gammaproteobacteria bacterium]|nr:hemin ABC transporter substrate-binding protein [Gammaproteobacteria bacterium]
MEKRPYRHISRVTKWTLPFFTFLLIAGCEESSQESQGIISIGGDITEIIYALGRIDQVIGRDTTSFYPESVTSLPDVGYVRQLGAEGLLSLSPDMIIASSETGPPEVVEQIRQTGIPFVLTEEGFNLAGLLKRIDMIGNTLEAETEAQLLSQEIIEKMRKIDEKLAAVSREPKVLFLMSASDGSPMAAGEDTAADAIINLAKGENIFASESGYKAYSYEALANARPDVIMMMEHSLASLGGIETIKEHPALGMTPAAQSGNIIAVDGLFLLGFGPRLPEAVAYIADRFHEGLGATKSIEE